MHRVAKGAVIFVLFVACGESRRPIGEECVRNEDCLSDVCAGRACASAPTLVVGAGRAPAEDGPRLPDGGPSSGDAGPDGAP